MTGAYAVMRLGAPHEGHAALVCRMVHSHPDEPVLVLVGSSDKTGRPDVPLAWSERRDILNLLIRSRGVDPDPIVYAPLPEIPICGFTRDWFEHVLQACRDAVGHEPLNHYFGDDYGVENFQLLLEMRPEVRLHRVSRELCKSGTELRRAVATQEPGLLEKYRLELELYPRSALQRIGLAARGVDGEFL